MKEMNLVPWGYIGWFLCVTGAVISSLPQWFIVALNRGPEAAVLALYIGLPILALGSILLVVAWLPEMKREYPEILETTMTPIPQYYLDGGEGP